MDTQSRAATQLLEALSFVNTLRETVGGINVVHALLETSAKEWANAKDASTDNHLIKGVAVSTKKSDAVHIYIAKIVAQNMRSVGNRLTAWTKATVGSENHTNVAVSNRISAGDFNEHTDLFKMVAGRLLGYDDGIIAFAMAETPRAKAEALVSYLATRFDLTENRETALTEYLGAIDLFEAMFEKNGFTNEYYLKTIGRVIAYYHSPVSEGTVLLDNPFDLLDMLATDAPFDSLSEAITTLGVVHTVIIDKDDPDPQATIAELRKIYGAVVYVAPNGVVDLNLDEPTAVQVGVVSPLPDDVRQLLSTAQLSVPQVVEAMRASSLTVGVSAEGSAEQVKADVQEGMAFAGETLDKPLSE